MNKDRIKEILFDQKEVFNNKKNLIFRDLNLDNYIASKQVIVITGVRRCGKSSLLYLIKEKMKLAEGDFCYFNFDDERVVAEIDILDKILSIHREIYGKNPILFFDEIQNVNKWEKFINRVYEQDIKVFITGSNAKLLSSEIATSLTGRNLSIELLPFSFKEILLLKEIDYDLNKLTSTLKSLIVGAFDQYMIQGGFPLVVKENNLELLNQYFQDILYRDIIARYRLSQVDELRQMAIYFFGNISKLFSYSTLQKITGIKSLSSIKDYLGFYNQSYLFFYLSKFDFSVKKQLMNPKKVYSIDTGLINRIGFSFSENKGRILENIVFLEHKRRKCEFFYFFGKNECDFIIKQGNSLIQAIQVSYNLNNENLEREISGLLEAKNVYELHNLLLLVHDEDISVNIPDEIQIMPVWKWLLI
ncbi:MAG: ATP-binding protein [Saprospiraceae bacterium]|nr:ATP-binding protein [Saprospiraceae bacterium]